MTPWGGPAVALAVGVLVALAGLTAYEKGSKRLSRLLIQICVSLLGFRVDLLTLAHEAKTGIAFSAATIVASFLLGFVLERMLRTGRELTLLVSSGTAICGGSAIAAVGASIGASSGSMAVATGAVFILNAVALFVFPALGHALGMSDSQFGTWAGVAIHDVSSVVGAATQYQKGTGSTIALDTANIVKLTRVLWIFPCAIFAAWITREGGARQSVKAPFPWFILFFLGASAVKTWLPHAQDIAGPATVAAKIGFSGALFLIGAGLSRSTLASVGWRVLAQAVIQWVLLAVASLLVVLHS